MTTRRTHRPPSSRLMVMFTLAAMVLAHAPLGAGAETTREIEMIRQLGRRAAQVEALQRDPIEAAILQHDVSGLLAQFRRADSAAARERVAGGLFRLGGAAPARLVDLLFTDFNRKLRDYKHAFQDEVVAAVRRRGGAATPQQIEQLQRAVQTVAVEQNLTKDMIVKQSDPAMAELESLLSIDRKAVLAGSPSLQQARKEMVELGALSARAATHLAAADTRTRDKVPNLNVLETELVEAEELAALMVTPMTQDARDVMFENVTLAKQLDPGEAEGIRILNLIRIRAGLMPLAIDLKLGDAARDHSKDMRRLNFFSHTSPVEGKTTPWDRAKLAGASASGENIFMGRDSAPIAIQAWWYSPGHHKNMMNPRFRRIGLGKDQTYWTQMFGW